MSVRQLGIVGFDEGLRKTVEQLSLTQHTDVMDPVWEPDCLQIGMQWGLNVFGKGCIVCYFSVVWKYKKYKFWKYLSIHFFQMHLKIL